MVAFTLIGQLGLPDGVAGHENEALTWVGPGPQDYELAPANAGSIEAVDITDATTVGKALIVATNAAAAQTAIGATTVGKAVIVAADMAAARTAIGAGTSNLAIGTTSSTAKAGDYAPTKTDVGLSNVDNTSDANKPVSTATTTALAGKEPTITIGTSAQYYRGDKTMQTLNKAAVGLSSVDNTTDLGKPISTATQAALDLKVGAASPTFTGTVTGVTKTHVGLGNVDNTADTAKPVSTAQQAALDLKVNLTAEIAIADIVDEADTATGLVTGRRMQKGVDAFTGGTQTILWNNATLSWPSGRLSALKWIFDSKGYPAATAPIGHSVVDEWWRDPSA